MYMGMLGTLLMSAKKDNKVVILTPSYNCLHNTIINPNEDEYMFLEKNHLMVNRKVIDLDYIAEAEVTDNIKDAINEMKNKPSLLSI